MDEEGDVGGVEVCLLITLLYKVSSYDSFLSECPSATMPRRRSVASLMSDRRVMVNVCDDFGGSTLCDKALALTPSIRASLMCTMGKCAGMCNPLCH